MEQSSHRQVQILSKRIIRPSQRFNDETNKLINLTAWDLKHLSIDYIQKGLLFNKPTITPISGDDSGGHEAHNPVIERLISSFGRALDRFYPLAGRLMTTNYYDNDDMSSSSSISIGIECNDEGAEFIHAMAPDVKVSDISDSRYIPVVVRSLFPLNSVPSYDGHILPLLAVQVTELSDGLFIGLSMNHSAADGTSFWHFFNTWSEFSRNAISGVDDIVVVPSLLERWFPNSCTPPIKLPFTSEADFIRRRKCPNYTECAFHFSASSVAKLKNKANSEMNTNKISSLQSILAHLWRSVLRARNVDTDQLSSYSLLMGCRTRVSPPLPSEYLGNSISLGRAHAKACEVLETGIGWCAWMLNRAIALQTEEMLMQELDEWSKSPSFVYMESEFQPCKLSTGSSPRFPVYENDFGWGKPLTVRSGVGNKGEGLATIYPGPENGSMALEVCLNEDALRNLIEDKEFMEMVSMP